MDMNPLLPQIETEGSPCQQSEISLGAQMQGYAGPQLPKEIWDHIHSLLPMRDAAQAACVSRDILRSWRSRPNLIFNKQTLGLNRSICPKDDTIMRNFTNRVDNIMKNHSGISVKILKFWFDMAHTNKDFCYLDHLDSWLRIAVKPGIEELQLGLFSTLSKRYNFPCLLLSGGMATSLRCLYLGACEFHPTVGCARSLKRLKLHGVCIEEEELRCFLSKTPALEWLDVRCCYPITSLRIPCLQHLSHLGISCKEKYMMQSIQSKAPNLSSFYFEDEIGILLLLGDDALLRIKKLHMACKNAVLHALTELPSSMPSLETLTISSCGEEAIPPMVASKFLHLMSLSICTSGSAYELWSLPNFLYAAPSLETLVLNVGGMLLDPGFADQSVMRAERRHKKLKSVKILHFCSAMSVVQFACHVLASALSLEQLTLDTTCGALRCSVSATGKCYTLMSMQAENSLGQVECVEPCSWCHAAQLLIWQALITIPLDVLVLRLSHSCCQINEIAVLVLIIQLTDRSTQCSGS